MTTIASIVPALADGYARRALVRRLEGKAIRSGRSGDAHEYIFEALTARGLGPDEIIATFVADGRWGSWARGRVVRASNKLIRE